MISSAVLMPIGLIGAFCDVKLLMKKRKNIFTLVINKIYI